MADKIGEAYIEISAKVDKLNADLNALKGKVQTSAAGMENSFKKTTSSLGGMDFGLKAMVGTMMATAAATMTVQKAFQFLSESLAKWDARKKALLGVDATLKSMGREGEFTSRSILKMADGLRTFNKYAVSTGEVLDMSTFLLTFEKINKETLPRAAQIVIDLSRKMGTDLKGAAMSVGIALDNPAEGLMRLGRAGVKFSKDEKEVIQALVDAGKAAEAQEMIFDKLEKKVGGFARATTDDLDEYEGRIGAAIDSLQRNIGKSIEGVIEPLMGGLASVFTRSRAAFFSAIETTTLLKSRFETLAFNVESLGKKTNRTSDETDLLTQSQDALLKEFPTYFAGLDTARIKFEDMSPAIAAARGQLDLYIDTTIRAAIAQDKLSEIVEIGKKNFEALEKQQAARQRLSTGQYEGVAGSAGTPYGSGGKTAQSLKDDIDRYARIIEDGQKKIAALVAQIRGVTISLGPKDFIGPTPPAVAIFTKTKEMLEAEAKAAREAAKALEELQKKRDEGAGQYGPENLWSNYGEGSTYTGPFEPPVELSSMEKQTAESLRLVMGGMEYAWAEGLDAMLKGTMNLGEGVIAIFTGMGNAVVAELERMIAKMIVFQVMKSAFSLFGGGELFSLLTGAHAGGDFVGTSSGVRKMAGGGSFVVPPGFQNDSYPLMVESGERVTVTPAIQVNAGGSNSDVIRQLQIINANLLPRRQGMGIDVRVAGELRGQDMYLLNKRAGRVYARSR